MRDENKIKSTDFGSLYNKIVGRIDDKDNEVNSVQEEVMELGVDEVVEEVSEEVAEEEVNEEVQENTVEGVDEVETLEYEEETIAQDEIIDEVATLEESILSEEGDVSEVDSQREEVFEADIEKASEHIEDSELNIQNEEASQEHTHTGEDSGTYEQGQDSLEEVEVDVEQEEELIDSEVEVSQPEVEEVEPNEAVEDEEQTVQTGVETELDEYGNTVEVFARARNSEISMFGVNQDTRIPSGTTGPAGSVSHFGETKGGVDFTINEEQKHKGVEDGKYEFQGTAKASLVFTGGLLDARATISIVSGVEGGIITLKNEGSQVATIREYLIKAANEKIDDINGYSTSLVSSIDDRANLVLALSAVLAANEGEDSKNSPLQLTFRDLDDIVPKQTTIDFVATALFTTSVDFVKNIVNEDSFVNNLSGASKTKGASNVNLNAEGIAVNIDFKAEDPKNGLKTNTRYEFIAPNKDILFFPNASTATEKTESVNYVEGLTMTQFKTGKQLPLFETYCISSGEDLITTISTIATSSLFSAATATSSKFLCTSIDFNSINNDSTFIDYDNMVSIAASNVALKVGGTSIRFNTLKIFDKDETITKMEIEDDRLNRYPVSLAPIDSNNLECGAYPQVNGLQRSTPYIFRKLYVTASPEDESITKTLQLVTLSCATKNNQGTVTAIDHNISIRTSNFTEPKLFIEWDSDKAYVKGGEFKKLSEEVEDGVPVFIPKLDVKLPNNIVMPAVKNDKTSLRYVIEVDNTEATIKDLTVNGLKGDEDYKVEKLEDDYTTYFILTLFNLSEDRDYGFLILELTYIDLDDRELITRQVLSGINVITNVSISSTGTDFTTTGIFQVPDQSLDNTTGPELMGRDIFNVTLFEAKTLEARKAEIPVFIDDMNGRFLRMEFKKPEGNPNVNLELDGSLLRFTNLEPKSEVVYKVDFIWKDEDDKEQTVSKYAKISTPQVPAVDVRSTTITTTDKTAEIVFDLYSEPKSTIKSVSLSDDDIEFTWSTSTLTLNLTGLKAKTEYKDLEITFKLENGLITKYKIDDFSTQAEIQPPTGKVAEFVSRIYTASLGREPEVEGWKFWVQKLESQELPVTQFVYNVMKQDEFIERYLSREEFIDMMYQIVVGREPEEEGRAYWEGKYEEYKVQEASLADLRIRIASEMMNESEFKAYVTSLGLKY